MRIRRCEFREGSGGMVIHRGGDGIVREYEFPGAGADHHQFRKATCDRRTGSMGGAPDNVVSILLCARASRRLSAANIPRSWTLATGSSSPTPAEVAGEPPTCSDRPKTKSPVFYRGLDLAVHRFRLVADATHRDWNLTRLDMLGLATVTFRTPCQSRLTASR